MATQWRMYLIHLRLLVVTQSSRGSLLGSFPSVSSLYDISEGPREPKHSSRSPSGRDKRVSTQRNTHMGPLARAPRSGLNFVVKSFVDVYLATAPTVHQPPQSPEPDLCSSHNLLLLPQPLRILLLLHQDRLSPAPSLASLFAVACYGTPLRTAPFQWYTTAAGYHVIDSSTAVLAF